MPGLVAREAAEVTSPSQRFGSTSKGHPGTSRHHQWHIQITEPYKTLGIVAACIYSQQKSSRFTKQ